MKSIGKLVAILLLLTVFFIRMASKLVSLDLARGAFAPQLAIFCVALILWLCAILWPLAYNESLQVFAATVGLLFVFALYLQGSTIDLVALLAALVLFTISLGRRGDTHSGAEMPSTTSTLTVASVSSEESPKSVVKVAPGKIQFVASKRGKFYHKVGSEWAKKIKKANRRDFVSKEDAWQAGYKAHKDLEK